MQIAEVRRIIFGTLDIRNENCVFCVVPFRFPSAVCRTQRKCSAGYIQQTSVNTRNPCALHTAQSKHLNALISALLPLVLGVEGISVLVGPSNPVHCNQSHFPSILFRIVGLRTDSIQPLPFLRKSEKKEKPISL